MEPSNTENSGDAPGSTLSQSSRQNWMLEYEDHKLKQRQVISDLQESLEKADEENIQLLRENAKLLAQNKSLQQVSTQSKVLVEELESVKQRLSSTRCFLRTVETQKKELEMKKSQLEEQVEELASKVFQYSEDKKALQVDVLQEKTLVLELEEKLQRSVVQSKEKEDLLKRKECCIEEMGSTITEHSAITEVLHNRVRNLQDNLEKAQQEMVLHKMEAQGAERMKTSPGSGCLMYEIVQAELERKLLQAHLDSERRLNRLFGLRLLLFILWRLLVLFHKAVALLVFLVLWVTVTVFYACMMSPTIVPQSIYSDSTLSMLQQVLTPWLTLHSDGPLPT